MRLLLILIIFSMLIIPSCIEKGQYYYGGYGIGSESDIEKFIILYKEPDSTDINPLGYKYDCKLVRYLDFFDNVRAYCLPYECEVIPPFIFKEESRFDNEFILIVQEPLPNEKGWVDKYKFQQYINPNYKEFSDVKIWYWIINKIDDIIYGPYTKEMYLEKRVEIGVPDSLRFRFEVEKQK